MKKLRLIFSLSLLYLCSTAICRADDAAAISRDISALNNPPHILDFPKGYSVGTLTIYQPQHAGVRGHAEKVEAKGRIVVPAGRSVTLLADVGLFKDPSVLNALPPDALCSLATGNTTFSILSDQSWDTALPFIAHLKGLQVLFLNHSDVTDPGLAKLCQLTNLKNLSIAHTQFTGAALKEMRGLKKLAFLRISENNIEEEKLRYLADLSSLHTLIVARSCLSNSAIKYIGKCSALTSLDISDNRNLNDDCLQFIRGLKQLRELKIFATGITIKGLLQLKGLPIKELEINNTIYKQSDLNDLRRAFPGMICRLHLNKKLDSESQTLLEPMH